MAAIFGEVEQCDRLRRLNRRDRECRDATFERGHALFESVLRRVHDPRVDIAEFRQPEERGGVIGVAKHVARGLINRNRASSGRWIGGRSRMNLTRLKSPLTAHRSLLCVSLSSGPPRHGFSYPISLSGLVNYERTNVGTLIGVPATTASLTLCHEH